MTQRGVVLVALALALAGLGACGKYGPPVRSQPEAGVEPPSGSEAERERERQGEGEEVRP